MVQANEAQDWTTEGPPPSIEVSELGSRSAFAALLAHTAFPEGTAWERRVVDEGDTLLEEGQLCGKLYFVLSGSLRVEGTVKLPSGRRFKAGVADVGVGSLLGEMALFDRQPHSATVTVVEAGEVAVVDGQRLFAFLGAHRDIGYDVLHEMLTQLVPRLRRMNERTYYFLAWGMKAHGLDDAGSRKKRHGATARS